MSYFISYSCPFHLCIFVFNCRVCSLLLSFSLSPSFWLAVARRVVVYVFRTEAPIRDFFFPLFLPLYLRKMKWCFFSFLLFACLFVSLSLFARVSAALPPFPCLSHSVDGPVVQRRLRCIFLHHFFLSSAFFLCFNMHDRCAIFLCFFFLAFIVFVRLLAGEGVQQRFVVSPAA